MKSNKRTARYFGAFFILAFLSYGIGTGIIQSILDSSGNLAAVNLQKDQIIGGSILMGVFHTFFNLGVAVIMFGVLKRVNRYIAHGYLSAAIVATSLLLIGSIFLLMLVPISELQMGSNVEEASLWDSYILLASKLNFYFYQFGMVVWSMGGIMLSYMLYKSKVVPRFFALWGYVGYAIFIVASIGEIMGDSFGLLPAIPGGLFEIALSVWLIVKGFDMNAEYAYKWED